MQTTSTAHAECLRSVVLGCPRCPTPPLQGEKRVPITAFDDWAQLAFGQEIKSLNRIQSKVFDIAFHSNENMLICAPTGAGKTNIALMTMLNLVGQHLHGGIIRKEEFKIVYVAPMKALAAEMAENFKKALDPYNLKVQAVGVCGVCAIKAERVCLSLAVGEGVPRIWSPRQPCNMGRQGSMGQTEQGEGHMGVLVCPLPWS